VKTKPRLPSPLDPLNDDIIVKDERRGLALDRMDFAKKQHLQGYQQ
jgi:hypothetical protein